MDGTTEAAARGPMLMIHGVGCTGTVWSHMAGAFRARGFTVETPTLKADLRTVEAPPAALLSVTLSDYIDEAEGWARAMKAFSGQWPVLVGHSMGGLIVQKLLERGVGRAGVLVTPAAPADVNTGLSPAVVFTFANILLARDMPAKAHKVWRTGFNWGVLNRTPRARHAEIHAAAVHDPGRVYQALGMPDKDPHRAAFVDENRIEVPVLTIGAAHDRATPIAGVRKTAAKYARVGGEYREYAKNAHWIIDEPGTDGVITDIDQWLKSKSI